MVWIENIHGEKVVELVPDGDFWKLPDGFVFDLLDVGDVYRVVSDEEQPSRDRETESDR